VRRTAVRLSLALLALSLLGALGGAWLIGQWAVGLVVLGYSVLLAVFALLRDDRKPSAALLDDGTDEGRFRRRVMVDASRRRSS
jgi:hypothetical protein